MKLLKDCWEARTGLPKVGDVVVSQHQKKVDWERKLLIKELEEKEDTLANLVTYQSDLVSREWRSADGVTAPVYQPPGLCDDMVCEPVNCAYSKAILSESELPPVHVRDKKKVGGPSPGVGGTLGPVLSPPNLGTQLSPSIPGDIKPKIRREDLLASALDHCHKAKFNFKASYNGPNLMCVYICVGVCVCVSVYKCVYMSPFP